MLGNHEKGWEQHKRFCSSIERLDSTTINGNHVVMCHYPMITWDRSHFNAWQLFGHHHNKSYGFKEIVEKSIGKTLNVNIEFHDYKPWSEEEIIEYMNTRPDNWDLIRK